MRQIGIPCFFQTWVGSVTEVCYLYPEWRKSRLHWRVLITSCFCSSLSRSLLVFEDVIFLALAACLEGEDSLFSPHIDVEVSMRLLLLKSQVLQGWDSNSLCPLVHCDAETLLINSGPLFFFSLVNGYTPGYLLPKGKRGDQGIASDGRWYKNTLDLAMEYVFVLVLEPGCV